MLKIPRTFTKMARDQLEYELFKHFAVSVQEGETAYNTGLPPVLEYWITGSHPTRTDEVGGAAMIEEQDRAFVEGIILAKDGNTLKVAELEEKGKLKTMTSAELTEAVLYLLSRLED